MAGHLYHQPRSPGDKYCHKEIKFQIHESTPSLISGSIKSTSVSLAISSSEPPPQLLYRRCVGDKSWQTVSVSRKDGTPVSVDSLTPYTCYQFSIVQCNVQSPPSHQIHTHSSGKFKSLLASPNHLNLFRST